MNQIKIGSPALSGRYAPNLFEVETFIEPKNTTIEFDKVLTPEQIAAIKTLVA